MSQCPNQVHHMIAQCVLTSVISISGNRPFTPKATKLSRNFKTHYRKVYVSEGKHKVLIFYFAMMSADFSFGESIAGTVYS